MYDNIVLIYKDNRVARYQFLPDSNNTKSFDESIILGSKQYFILGALSDKGVCAIIVKDASKKVIFSTIFDSYGKPHWGTVLLFKITKKDYLQLDIV